MVFNKPLDLKQHLEEGACMTQDIIKSSASVIPPINNQSILPMLTNPIEQPRIPNSVDLSSNINVNNTEKRTNGNTAKYVCETCQKPFRTHASIKQHRFTHLDEKKFVCKFCPKTFKRVSGLNQVNYLCFFILQTILLIQFVSFFTAYSRFSL